MILGKWSEAQKRYAQSSKGWEARRHYQQSEKGKATRATYIARRKTKLAEVKQETIKDSFRKKARNYPTAFFLLSFGKFSPLYELRSL